MGRSISKGPYIAYHLLNKLKKLNEKGKKETFTFIPCGGLNYPINLDFSLQSYELNPDIA